MRDLLRFLTCGSVDDGKSTLIGRLLYDTQAIYVDQLAAVARDSSRFGTTGAGAVDLALLTDGLKAEREQGITIDVAYRYFSTDRRTFIIADTPGHEQYTRNMATGASTCRLAVILVDARRGVLVQTRRHSIIAALLGIRDVVVAVNKMDLVGYDQNAFERVRHDYGPFAARLGFRDVRFVPISSLIGDNVVVPSAAMPWYDGPSLLAHLETVPIADEVEGTGLRFPVQYVIRPHPEFRGYAGTIASGALRTGDEVLVLPSGRRSSIASIVAPGGERDVAIAPMAVTVTLQDELDVSRGDWIVHPEDTPRLANQVEATVVWMADEPLVAGRQYWVKHVTRTVPGRVADLRFRLDVNTLERRVASQLAMNEVGQVSLTLDQAIPHDPYALNRGTGAFILIDRLTNDTVGAGMILAEAATPMGAAGDAPGRVGGTSLERPVSVEDREARLGQKGAAVLFFGDDAGRRATLARALERRLFDDGLTVTVLDGRELRRGLSRDLTDTGRDQAEHLRRGSEVARLLSDAGLVCIAAFDAAPDAAREEAGAIVGPDRCVSVLLTDGASRTGTADLVVATGGIVEDAVDRVVALLRQRGLLA